MELRYQMTDILPLLPIPQPPYGKSAYSSGSKSRGAAWPTAARCFLFEFFVGRR